MHDLHRIARGYLSAHASSYWNWSDDGAAICWRDGTTIAFKEEVDAVLDRLAPNGLPPMDALVPLLAACRNSWSANRKVLSNECYALIRSDRRVLSSFIETILLGLDQVNSLDESHRCTIKAKMELAELVFDTSPNRGRPEDGRSVLVALTDPIREVFLRRNDPTNTFGPLLHGLRALHGGLPLVDEDALSLRARTGLDQMVIAPEIDLEVVPRMRQLLGAMADDEELGGLAMLARNVMAAITLPRQVDDPDEMPLGGVSDISNRGPLDRLLTSELAHDDLTLAVRIANNEALFLRREAPPQPRTRQRVLLLDAGIRMWGVPRVFATAVAMALIANSDRRTEVLVFRADATDAIPVDLTTREGILKHLEALHTEAHPGAALSRVATADAEHDVAVETVVITSDFASVDADFVRAANADGVQPLFVASVSRGGELVLEEFTTRGRKQLRGAKLDLDSVLEPRPRPTTPLVDKSVDHRMPAIFNLDPFPILLPHSVKVSRARYIRGFGVLSLTRDHRLMHWKSPEVAARQLSTSMPSGALIWTSPTLIAGKVYAAIGREQGPWHWVTVDPERCVCEVEELQDLQEPRQICSHQGVVFVICKRQVSVISPPSPACLGTLQLPGELYWRHGRFLGRYNAWYALAYDGLNPHLQLVVERSSDIPLIHRLFECEGIEGPVGITSDGHLWYSAERRKAVLRHRGLRHVLVESISRNGKRAVFRDPWSDRRLIVDVANATTQIFAGDPMRMLEREVFEVARSRTLRKKFNGIYVDSGSIVLVSRRGAHLRFALQADLRKAFDGGLCDSQRIRFVHHQAAHDAGVIPFERMDGLGDVGFSLKVATFADGSRAFLDSRGLLHLKCSDRGVPEFSLVLSDGNTACWTNQGQICGPAYFTGGDSNAEESDVFVRVLSRFANAVQ